MKYEQVAISALNEVAQMTTYILDNNQDIDVNRKRPMLVICPGGGYSNVSQRESEAVAIRFNAMGFHAAILRYSVAPAAFPTALAQLATAVAVIRQNAKPWNVDKDSIFVLGFSAGGHLAASLGVFWNSGLLRDALPNHTAQQIKPNRMVLCYPVISSGRYRHEGSFRNLLGNGYNDTARLDLVSLEKRVTKDTPPAFLWHTAQDLGVPPQNSILFANALLENGIPCELHLYPMGCHGLSLASGETCGPGEEHLIVQSCQNWVDMAGRFLGMSFSHTA